METGEEILGSYDVRVYVNWSEPIELWTGKKYVKRKALGLQKGFPAVFLISESRIFLMSEFVPSRVYTGIIVPFLPTSKEKHRTFYMELALDKIVRYSFKEAKNYIIFEPHGQLGTTIVQFKELPENTRKEIEEKLERAMALNLKAPDAGRLISDKPVREIFLLRWQIINTQRQKTPKIEATVEEIVKSVEEIEPKRVIIPPTRAELVINPEAEISEATISDISVDTSVSQKESKMPPLSLGIEATTAQSVLETAESFYYRSGEERQEDKQRLEGIWKSLVPRETICPYCKTRVLTIDRICPRCGAINL